MNDNIIEQEIRGDMITLGQLIKVLNLVSSGAEVKQYLHGESVFVNGDADDRRGRKLYPGDLIKLGDGTVVRLTSQP